MPRPRPSVAPGGPPPTPSFIAYFRVSTDKQGKSGLGLEAQRAAVEAHVARAHGQIVAEFQEIESGKRNDRPQIAAAIAACRRRRATLVIAKLDRLARNVAFVANLMESGVEFVACDNPNATRVLVHLLVAFAEHEREQISRRTRDALAAAKARGIKLGNPKLQAGSAACAREARSARSAISKQHASDVLPIIREAEEAGARSLRKKAAALTARGIRTPSGGDRWHASQVRRIEQHR